MSFVVRHKDTGCYLQGEGQWTEHVGAALHFNSGIKLVIYLEHLRLREKSDTVEIVILPVISQTRGVI